MEAAQPLHRDDGAVRQQACGGGDGVRIVAPPSVRIRQPQPRSAGRTGDGLGVVTAVPHIAVFRGAGGAEGEAGHGGLGPVVRHIGDDAVAWSAMHAGDEGVPVAPVGGIAQLPQAFGTGGAIGRDGEILVAGPARGLDDDAGQAGGHGGFLIDGGDARQRRRRGESGPETGDGLGGTLHRDGDALRVIGDTRRDAAGFGQPHQEGTHADALYAAAEAQAACARRDFRTAHWEYRPSLSKRRSMSISQNGLHWKTVPFQLTALTSLIPMPLSAVRRCQS